MSGANDEMREFAVRTADGELVTATCDRAKVAASGDLRLKQHSTASWSRSSHRGQQGAD